MWAATLTLSRPQQNAPWPRANRSCPQLRASSRLAGWTAACSDHTITLRHPHERAVTSSPPVSIPVNGLARQSIGAPTAVRSSRANDTARQQPCGGSVISLALQQFHFGFGALHQSCPPWQLQSIDHCRIVGLNAMCEADERTESARNRIHQPPIRITHPSTRDQPAESLE